MNESDLHNDIYARSHNLIAGGSNTITVGPGDDCAVISSAKGELSLLTVDQLVAGRHFVSETPIDLIARKAIARSVSDIAAMGGVPSWAMATCILPKDYQHADQLFDAMSTWATHFGCPLIGGDIASHASTDHPLALTVTVGGTMLNGHQPVLRSGAKPSDLLYLTGPVGASFQTGRHLNFEPRVEVGQWASKNNSHAMIDLSDGLGRDSDRIAVASNVRIEIDASKLPINPECPDWQNAMGDGEDYELLIALDPGCDLSSSPIPLMGPIGTVRVCKSNEKPGSSVLDPGGVLHDASTMGWDH